MRFPELDQEVVQVRPPHSEIRPFNHPLIELATTAEGNVKRNLLKVSMRGGDTSE